MSADASVPIAVMQLLDRADSRQMLTALLSIAPLALCATDAHGRVTYFSCDDHESWGLADASRSGAEEQWNFYLSDGSQLPAEECPIARALQERTLVSARATFVRRADGSLARLDSYAAPVLGPSPDEVAGAVNVLIEQAERSDAEPILIRELKHRLQNFFAVAVVLLRLSAASAKTPAELAEAVERRLNALSRAHALGVPAEFGGTGRQVRLHTLVRTILKPYMETTGGDRVRFSGPNVALAPAALSGLALMLHELGTNSLKYGALSAATGAVAIEARDEGDRFALVWRECGGPPVTSSSRRGFGVRLVERVAAGMSGASQFDWAPEGLVVELRAPKRAIAAAA